MIKNSKLKYYALLAVAALVPLLVLVFDIKYLFQSASSLFPLGLLVSSAILAALFAVKPSPLLLVAPLALYGGMYALSGSFVVSAFSAVALPMAIGVGICMRRKLARGLTVTVATLCMAGGVGMCFVILTAICFGNISVSSFVRCYNSYIVPAAHYFKDLIGQTMAESMERYAESFGVDSFDATDYALAYVASLKTVVFGWLFLGANIISYAFTALSGRTAAYVDDGYLKALPGVNGRWEFVLAKSSAVVFIVCYACLKIGGDDLTVPQVSAFNAIMYAIIGGVLVMAFRTIKERIRSRGGVEILIMAVVGFVFFGDTFMSFAITALTVVGLYAALRAKKETDDKCKE